MNVRRSLDTSGSRVASENLTDVAHQHRGESSEFSNVFAHRLTSTHCGCGSSSSRCGCDSSSHYGENSKAEVTRDPSGGPSADAHVSVSPYDNAERLVRDPMKEDQQFSVHGHDYGIASLDECRKDVAEFYNLSEHRINPSAAMAGSNAEQVCGCNSSRRAPHSHIHRMRLPPCGRRGPSVLKDLSLGSREHRPTDRRAVDQPVIGCASPDQREPAYGPSAYGPYGLLVRGDITPETVPSPVGGVTPTPYIPPSSPLPEDLSYENHSDHSNPFAHHMGSGCHTVTFIIPSPVSTVKMKDTSGLVGDVMLREVFRCIYTAFMTIDTLIARHEAGQSAGVGYLRHIIEPSFRDNFTVLEFLPHHIFHLYEMWEAFDRAGTRMLQPFNAFVAHHFSCNLADGESPFLNPGDGVNLFTGVCANFATLPWDLQMTHVIATLLATSTMSNHPLGVFNGRVQFARSVSAWAMAAWAYQRWQEHGSCLHSDQHLDERPLNHQRPQFRYVVGYWIASWGNNNEPVAQGWRRAFDMLEPGLRFIYRLILLNNDAEREQMWHYGGTLSPAHYFGDYTRRRLAMVFLRLFALMHKMQYERNQWIYYWPHDNTSGGRSTTIGWTTWLRSLYAGLGAQDRGCEILHEQWHDSLANRGIRDWRRLYCSGGTRDSAGAKCYGSRAFDFGAGDDTACGVLAIRCRNPEHACSNIDNFVSWLSNRSRAGWLGWPPDFRVIGEPLFVNDDPKAGWVNDPVDSPPFFDTPEMADFVSASGVSEQWFIDGSFTPDDNAPSETGTECNECDLANNSHSCSVPC